MNRIRHFERTQVIRAPMEEVFSFFSEATNLETLTPPFLRFRILTPLPIEMRAGTRIEYTLSLFGVPVRWRTHISDWKPGQRFVDEQEKGPFALWRHLHEFEDRGSTVHMRDRVTYAVPFGPVGEVAHALFVGRTVKRIFDFRQRAIQRVLEGRDTPVEVEEAEHPEENQSSPVAEC